MILAPLGTSGHNINVWVPHTDVDNLDNKCVKRSVRRYPRSGLDAFGRCASTNVLLNVTGENSSVANLTESFT